jgi:hypothetical protein
VKKLALLAFIFAAASCGPGEESQRTPGAVGATRLIELDRFSGGYQPFLETLIEHMKSELDLDPGEYYVNIRVARYTNVMTFTVWHMSAFSPGAAAETNPGGRSFQIKYDPNTKEFDEPYYWP